MTSLPFQSIFLNQCSFWASLSSSNFRNIDISNMQSQLVLTGILWRYSFRKERLCKLGKYTVTLTLTPLSTQLNNWVPEYQILRYRQIVTVKRIHVILITFWIASGVNALFESLNYRISFWYSFRFIASCMMITFASYSKIFRALRLHYTQVQDHAQQHPSQPNVLNIAWYRKAVYNTLWVQLALFVCYLPYCILVILITFSKISPTHLAFSVALTEVFISFNSNLNPFIYCWKISEVRQAVKQTPRQALCCS